jgi:hypothetical protein
VSQRRAGPAWLQHGPAQHQWAWTEQHPAGE